jgi:hypothetical protein
VTKQRERLTQIVLVIVGLVNLAQIIFYTWICGILPGFWSRRTSATRCF